MKICHKFVLLILLFALLVGAIHDLTGNYRAIIREGSFLQPSFIAIISFSILIFTFFILLIWKSDFIAKLRSRIKISHGVKWIPFFLVPILITFLLFFSRYYIVLQGNCLRLWVAAVGIGIMAWIISDGSRKGDWHSLFMAALVYSTILILSAKLQYVVNYPLPIYWSEGNRFWDYSILFGRARYLYPTSQSIYAMIESGRQLLWGLAYLLPDLNIAAMRLWDVVLMSIPYALLGLLLFRHHTKHKLLLSICALWSLLFINQGPVYAMLILAAILTILAIDLPLIPQLFLVGAASYFAAVNRTHWFSGPPLWAVLAVFVGNIIPQNARVKHRWWRSIAIAITGLFAGLVLPAILHNLQTPATSTSVLESTTKILDFSGVAATHTFLFERLFPNPTHPLGLLVAVLLAALPVVLLLIIYKIIGKWKLGIWQVIAIFSINTIFLIVGMVVSVKIGGGNNLHNLDLFLISLLFTFALAWKAGLDQWFLKPEKNVIFINILLLAVVIIPALEPIMTAEPLTLPNQKDTDAVIQQIQDSVNISLPNGEILFIDQRQLITFGYIQNVPLVPDYEKKVLMNLAMENKLNNLEPFYQDLKNRRFSLIVSDPLRTDFQGGTNIFGEENDAWVKNIARPILCFYEPQYTFEDLAIQLLIPREDIAIGFDGHLCP